MYSSDSPAGLRRNRRRLLGAFLVLALVPLAAGCGQEEQRTAQNLCAQYEQLVAAADEVRALDLRTAKAEEMGGKIDALLVELDQLQAVSEGRYDTLISALRSALYDLKQSAVETGDALEESRQQLQESLQPLTQRVANLKQRLDAQCSAT